MVIENTESCCSSCLAELNKIQNEQLKEKIINNFLSHKWRFVSEHQPCIKCDKCECWWWYNEYYISWEDVDEEDTCLFNCDEMIIKSILE